MDAEERALPIPQITLDSLFSISLALSAGDLRVGITNLTTLNMRNYAETLRLSLTPNHISTCSRKLALSKGRVSLM
jgi:hypothetical protein